MEKNFLADILKIDKQAEKAIIDLFNQYKVDRVDVGEYGWVAVNVDFSTFDIDTISCVGGNKIILFNQFSEEFNIDELMGGEMSRLYHLLLDEMDNLVKDKFDKLAEIENDRIENYYKDPQLEKYLVFVPNDFLESHKFDAEDDNNFITMGYHFGKVLTAEEFANLYNAYQLGDLTNNDKYTMRTYTMDTKIIEYCPHCECEVLIDTKFEIQTCPVCGKKITPCNLCNGICCHDCPLKARHL
jgi:hypothetical protein